MNTYGWILLGQTLLALFALGLCGGWILWQFRRDERPYLWLATPLAGLFALGGSVAALYFFGRLPFRWCLGIAFSANAIGTALCLVRGKAALPPLGRRAVATAVVLAVAYWGTFSCNKTAIDAREPTIASMDGSDMYGYAMVADWLRAHPASERPRVDQTFEALQYVNLLADGSRPVAFLLLTTASEVRGTTGAFSYDWTAGVILSAAIIGLAGLFGPNALVLVLLAAGGASTNWLANARTGFMGKSLAYPGSLLLVALVLATLAESTRRRVATVAGLGFALSFSLNPIFPAVLTAVVLGSHVGARGATAVVDWWRGDGFRVWRGVVRPVAGAALLFAVAVLPAFLIHRQVYTFMPPPPAPIQWAFVVPVSLDLEITAYPAVKAATQVKLMYAWGGLLAVALAAAVWYRHVGALTLLGCSLLVPAAWLIGEYRLYTFHGLLYPLALAGIAVLAEPLRDGRRGWVRLALLAGLMVATIALRVPQVRVATDRYVTSVQPHRVITRQSDIRAIRRVVGSDTVDAALAHYSDNHLAAGELSVRGVAVQYRPPGWERGLGVYASFCVPLDPLAPKGRYTLLEKNAWAPVGTERWVGSRLKLVEDRDSVSVLGVLRAVDVLWDPEWRPGVWLGNKPAEFLIHNGTGKAVTVRLMGIATPQPRPDRTHNTLVYRHGGSSGRLTFGTAEGTVTIPLHLTPGLNRVELSVDEPVSPPPVGLGVPLLAFRSWRIESTEAAARAEQQ